MRRLHIIGRKNHGKTTLIAELIAVFTSRGLRVGTIKHTHHQHELDTPGKDSHRHRLAGADCVGILTPGLNAAFWPVKESEPDETRYAMFDKVMARCDLVLVEGDTQTRADKIEVWRQSIDGQPLAVQDRSILAVVSDDQLDVACARFSRQPLDPLVAWIMARS
jgi:molybdopterin-guanine dinucleotide biosynthesis protein B